MVSDGHASVTQPSFSVNMTWSMPGQIAGSGGKASLGVMTTGGVAQRICVLQAYTSFTIEGGGDSCATTSASMASASASPNLLPKDAADGTIGYVWVSLGDGGNLYYTYKASTPQSAVTVETVPTPSAFDQTVTAPEPPPGGNAIITSPSLAAFGVVSAPSAVSVEVNNLTVQDMVAIAAERHKCYVEFRTGVNWVLKLQKLEGRQDWDTNYTSAYRYAVVRQLGRLVDCLAFVNAVEQVLYKKAAADIALVSCATTPVSLSIVGSRSRPKLRSLRVDKHPTLRVSCTHTAAGVRISIATRSRRTPLSSIFGSRLRLAIARSPHDSPGGQLSATFHRG
jgi:hypothetical protein